MAAGALLALRAAAAALRAAARSRLVGRAAAARSAVDRETGAGPLADALPQLIEQPGPLSREVARLPGIRPKVVDAPDVAAVRGHVGPAVAAEIVPIRVSAVGEAALGWASAAQQR